MQDSKDPDGLRIFYYLVQDLKSLVFSLIGLHFKVRTRWGGGWGGGTLTSRNDQLFDQVSGGKSFGGDAAREDNELAGPGFLLDGYPLDRVTCPTFCWVSVFTLFRGSGYTSSAHSRPQPGASGRVSCSFVEPKGKSQSPLFILISTNVWAVNGLQRGESGAFHSAFRQKPHF